MSQILKILFKTGDISTCVLRGNFVSRYVQLKSTFSDKKTSAVKSETHFSKEAMKINVAKCEGRIPSLTEVTALHSCS